MPLVTTGPTRISGTYFNFQAAAKLRQVKARFDRPPNARENQAGIVGFEVVDVHSHAVNLRPSIRLCPVRWRMN